MSGCKRHTEVADAVRAWQQPRQNAGVRAIGDRAGRERLRKTDSLLREQIKCGSLDSIVSVTVNVVSTERIHRNKEDIGAGSLVLIWRMAGTSASGEQTAEKEEGPHRAESITAAGCERVKRNFGQDPDEETWQPPSLDE